MSVWLKSWREENQESPRGTGGDSSLELSSSFRDHLSCGKRFDPNLLAERAELNHFPKRYFHLSVQLSSMFRKMAQFLNLVLYVLWKQQLAGNCTIR